jgi:replication-associated recombination protein RarA
MKETLFPEFTCEESMYNTHFAAKTTYDYPLDEVVSSLQKSIRRGDEENAMWWAFELEPKFHQYMWRRLGVIACEDVGLANPTAVVVVNACRESYYFHRTTSKRPDPNYVTLAVVTLCRSLKSREGNDLQALILAEREAGDKLPPQEVRQRHAVPDYALDLHTRRGRSMKRGLEHWLREASQLVNELGKSRYHDKFVVMAKKKYRP